MKVKFGLCVIERLQLRLMDPPSPMQPKLTTILLAVFNCCALQSVNWKIIKKYPATFDLRPHRLE
jgi:hypothetical protein